MPFLTDIFILIFSFDLMPAVVVARVLLFQQERSRLISFCLWSFLFYSHGL